MVKRQIYAQVVAVVPGSPAAKAGFQVSDMVRKLDGDSIGPMSAWTLERRLRGPVGSDLTLLRYAAANGDLKKITLKRERIQPPPITVRKEPRATVVGVADLAPGRAAELKALLPGLDHKLPLVLDLRQCTGGVLAEAALVAGLFVGDGPLATVQETGKAAGRPWPWCPPPCRPSPSWPCSRAPTPWAPAEALVLRPQEAVRAGVRRADLGLGVERTRFLLRQGGAAEVVNKRWLGAGGEFLGAGGEKPEAMKPQDAVKGGPAPAGRAPGYGGAAGYVIKADRPDDHVVKGTKPEDDPLPRILEILGESKAKAAA